MGDMLLPGAAKTPASGAPSSLNGTLSSRSRSDRYDFGVAFSHYDGASLSEARGPRANPNSGNRELTVTSALTLPGLRAASPANGSPLTSSWPETPAGADPLPGQLDRWLAARGADLVAVRRPIHANPEFSGQEFETAALIARELAKAGLAPR